MIKEIVKFTESLDDDFKNLGIRCKEGLHILLQISSGENGYYVNTTPINYEYYSKKLSNESEFLIKCKNLAQNGWCIDTNKCFDLPAKSIHSCSPFLVAFKREHLEGGEKFNENATLNKKQIHDRFDDYFDKAVDLLSTNEQISQISSFRDYFTSQDFKKTLQYIESKNYEIEENIKKEIYQLETRLDLELNNVIKDELKAKISDLEKILQSVKTPENSEYYLFYLNEPLDDYIQANNKYLTEKLFNTDKYNTLPDANGVIYGTSNFMNSFNSKMPFLNHQTASFNITGRISNIEAKLLNDFLQLLGRKILPNPLPIFVFKEELQKKVIGLFKESGFKIGFREIIEKLITNYKEDISNYYLLNWGYSADGIEFRDFDFVANFEYEFNIEIQDLFNADNTFISHNIFDFQNNLLPIIFNNNLIVKTKDGGVIQKYFDDIEPKYCKSQLNFLLIVKYRKAIYDFIYKSKRNTLTPEIFHDIMKTTILEDIRLDKLENNHHKEKYSILKKLNIWFSMYETFNYNNQKNEQTMANKLKSYQDFVSNIMLGNADLTNSTEEQFMFTAGQVISYLISKSKSADQSYQLLEPYLQKSNSRELQKAIANDFARYKHANYSNNFEKAASFVLTYETNENLKNYLPQLLAGIFSENQLFSNKKETINI